MYMDININEAYICKYSYMNDILLYLFVLSYTIKLFINIFKHLI